MQFNPSYKGGEFKSTAEFGSGNDSFDTGIRKHGELDLKKPQTKTVVPNDNAQVVVADKGCYLKEVTVQRIPNSYGHITYSGGIITVW